MSLSGYAPGVTPRLDFGPNGRMVSAPVDPTAGENQLPHGSVIFDPSGRILVAGSRQNGMMAVWRFSEDGAPDLEFGELGCASYNASATGSGHNEADALAVQADGMIVAAGCSERDIRELDVAVWRLREDGTLDNSFNSVGYVLRDARGGHALRDAAYGVALDSKGRILVSGQSVLGLLGEGTFMILWRFCSDGTVNTSFGEGGLVVAPTARP